VVRLVPPYSHDEMVVDTKERIAASIAFIGGISLAAIYHGELALTISSLILTAAVVSLINTSGQYFRPDNVFHILYIAHLVLHLIFAARGPGSNHASAYLNAAVPLATTGLRLGYPFGGVIALVGIILIFQTSIFNFYHLASLLVVIVLLYQNRINER
jgi:hypothetical protein